MTSVEGVPLANISGVLRNVTIMRCMITQPNIPEEQVAYRRPSPLPRRLGSARLMQLLVWKHRNSNRERKYVDVREQRMRMRKKLVHA